MYIVALAWIYVVLMVSIMQPTVFKGIVTFLGTGLLPLALFLYLMGTPQRRRNQKRAQALAQADAGAETDVEARAGTGVNVGAEANVEADPQTVPGTGRETGGER